MGKKGSLALLVCFLCLVSSAWAGIDISQNHLDFGELMSGAEGQKTLRITSDSADPVKIKAELSSPLQGIVSIQPEHNLFVQKGAPLELKINALSSDAEGKLHLFFEKVERGAITSFGSNFVSLGVSVSQTVQERRSLSIDKIILFEAEEGNPPVLAVSIANKGNTAEELSIFALAAGEEYSARLFIPALYGGTENLILPFDLEIGEYPLKLVVSSSSFSTEKELPLIIIPKGASVKKVSLPAVFSEVKDGRVYVSSILDNKAGPLPVKIRQELYDGEILAAKSEHEQILFAGENRVESSFELAGSGKYLIRTTAYYGNTYTDTYENSFALTGAGEEIPLAASLWVILFSLAVLVLVILKKKKWK